MHVYLSGGDGAKKGGGVPPSGGETKLPLGNAAAVVNTHPSVRQQFFMVDPSIHMIRGVKREREPIAQETCRQQAVAEASKKTTMSLLLHPHRRFTKEPREEIKMPI